MLLGMHAVGLNRPSCSQITAKEDKINATGYRHSDNTREVPVLLSTAVKKMYQVKNY